MITYSLIFINFFCLSDLFFKNEKKSFFISCLCFIAITFSLDSSDLTKLILTPATLAWLFSLISINFYFRKRYTLAFLMAGIASLFQTIIGGISFGIIIGDVILSKLFSVKEKLINVVKAFPYFIYLIINPYYS